MSVVLDPAEFREAMARFASGVTVVMTRNSEGAYVGFTASAFSSLSLNPSLLLVCLQKDADCYGTFMEAPEFALSILSFDQAEIAVRFATKAIDKLKDTPTVSGPATALPLVEGAAAHAECRIRDRFEGGDHTILVGEVLRAASTDAEPLLHFNRQFGRFVPDGK